MYDQSLEQLIDAVIADGVITDQERKVVYKKAASLGIDQDEIEVYLEGRLSKVSQSKPKSNKKGEIKTCPNCGANLGSFVGKCPECGHEIIGVESNHSAKEFLAKVEAINNKPRKFMDDGPEHEVATLIENFPIPNTKDDFVEFGSLCLTGMKNDDPVISDAWSNKATQIILKGNLLFANDPTAQNLITLLQTHSEKTAKKNKSTQRNIIIGIVAFIVIGCGLVALFESNDEDYVNQKIEQINQLPTPTAENYLDCHRQFSKIYWDKDTVGAVFKSGYRAFCESQDNYRELLRMAYIKAGVSAENLPKDLKTASTPDINSDNTSSDSFIILQEADVEEADVKEADLD